MKLERNGLIIPVRDLLIAERAGSLEEFAGRGELLSRDNIVFISSGVKTAGVGVYADFTEAEGFIRYKTLLKEGGKLELEEKEGECELPEDENEGKRILEWLEYSAFGIAHKRSERLRSLWHDVQIVHMGNGRPISDDRYRELLRQSQNNRRPVNMFQIYR